MSSRSQSLQLPVQLLEKDKGYQMTDDVTKAVAETSGTHSASVSISLYWQGRQAWARCLTLTGQGEGGVVSQLVNESDTGCIPLRVTGGWHSCHLVATKHRDLRNVELLLLWASMSRLPIAKQLWSLNTEPSNRQFANIFYD